MKNTAVEGIHYLPIYKNTDKTDWSNYSEISLLSTSYKILFSQG